MALSRQAKVFITAIITFGIAALVTGLVQFQSNDLPKFLAYLVIALAASVLKVKLPGITSTMSVTFLFVLVGIIELTVPETLAMTCGATLLQAVIRTKTRPRFVQVLFNISVVSIATSLGGAVYHTALLQGVNFRDPLLLTAAACAYFVGNSFPVAAIISLVEHKPFSKMWKECYFWSFPYYIVGAGIAEVLHVANERFGWPTAIFVLPLVYTIFRSYRLYLSKLESEKSHSEQVAALHLRTIEALSLAIDAKDHRTSEHLRRVQVYALEIGKELGLGADELNALRAASLLHDIGKLAVPEHIISKPGRLTKEEFEKMKIHPLVGAEILEQIDFPYPVVPIVRAHHERWDGTGYPYGLKGEEIPIGARILSAVDCLDALASDRQYRRALPLEEAMSKIASESGTTFDPNVVAILRARYRELEKMALQTPVTRPKLSTSVPLANGIAPAAALETTGGSLNGDQGEPLQFLDSIASARREVQSLFELTQDIGNSLSLSETLSVLAVRLKTIVPYDSIAIYVVKGDRLVPEYVSGDDFRLFSSLNIPRGEGLSGWVAANDEWVVNSDPSLESAYSGDPSKTSILRSALSVPLNGLDGAFGALTLYRAEKDAFTKDNLRVLLALRSKVSLAIENALRFRQAESCATTDFLTGLPNARSLFLHLDEELARCRRGQTPLAVLVCDLDGFKQINDRFGHLMGNRLLQMVASSLKEHCREYDYVARLGGDEFVLVLPGLSPRALETRIGELETAVLIGSNQICGEPLVSLSVGAARYPDDSTDAEGLLAEADRKMYATKESHKRANVLIGDRLWATMTVQ